MFINLIKKKRLGITMIKQEVKEKFGLETPFNKQIIDHSRKTTVRNLKS